MSANGYIPDSELEAVNGPEERLAHTAAHAYFWLQAAFAKVGVKLTTSAPAGCYRSYFVQGDMHVHPAKYDLNPNSSISLASAGYSTHGWGTRCDMLFNGSSWPTPDQLSLCAKYGWTREFGANDPNHFKHDGVTAIQPFVAGPTAAEQAQALEMMEDSMDIFKGDKESAVYALVGGHKRHIAGAEATILKATGSWHVATVPQSQADAIPDL